MMTLKEIFDQYTCLQREEKNVDYLRRTGRRFVIEQENLAGSQKIFNEMVREFDVYIEQLLKQ